MESRGDFYNSSGEAIVEFHLTSGICYSCYMLAEFSFAPTRYQLRVFSAVASNFAVVWLAASFATRDITTLLVNLLLGIVSLWFAIVAEKKLEYYVS